MTLQFVQNIPTLTQTNITTISALWGLIIDASRKVRQRRAQHRAKGFDPRSIERPQNAIEDTSRRFVSWVAMRKHSSSLDPKPMFGLHPFHCQHETSSTRNGLFFTTTSPDGSPPTSTSTPGTERNTGSKFLHFVLHIIKAQHFEKHSHWRHSRTTQPLRGDDWIVIQVVGHHAWARDPSSVLTVHICWSEQRWQLHQKEELVLEASCLTFSSVLQGYDRILAACRAKTAAYRH